MQIKRVQMNAIFTRKVLHLASFWTSELGIKLRPFKAQRITHQLKTTQENVVGVPQRITHKGDLESR